MGNGGHVCNVVPVCSGGAQEYVAEDSARFGATAGEIGRFHG